MQIVIPAFNEADRLPRTLELLRSRALELGRVVGRIEVLVVDNASHDLTAVVAAAADSALLPVTVISCPVPGKGAAVAAGLRATTHELVGFMDADGATDLDAVRDAWAAIAGGADIAIGSRAVAGALTNERHTWVRARGAAAFRHLSRRVVPGIADTQCGFKVFRGDLARTLASLQVSTGFSFDVEMLARARQRGAVITEFPVTWTDVPGSTFVPGRHGLAAFAELGRIAWRVQRSPQRVPVPVAPFAVIPPLTGEAGLEA